MIAADKGHDPSATRLRRIGVRQGRPGDPVAGEPVADGPPALSRRTIRRFQPSSAPVEVDKRSPFGNGPTAVAANLLVVILPASVVWAVAPGDSFAVLLGSALLAVVSSVAMASVAAAVWRRRQTCSELVFSDLILWCWVRRVRNERRLAEAREVLIANPGCETAPAPPDGRRVAALRRLSQLIDAQDPYTRGHSLRVTRHAVGIARAIRLPDCDVAKLRTAAALHDIGKLHTPARILQKPGRLTDEEFVVIKRHPGDGADMLSPLDDPAVAAMVRHHHERLDGSGYPDGLAGDEIPLGARIIAVADTFDAMTSNRAYRGAFQHEKALEVLSSEAGSRLDAAAVSAFRAYYSGRGLVAWSALLATTAPRLVAWLASGQQVVTGATPSLAKALPAFGAAALLLGPAGGPAREDGSSKPTGREASPAAEIASASSRHAPSGAGSPDRSARRPVRSARNSGAGSRRAAAPAPGGRRGTGEPSVPGATRAVGFQPSADAHLGDPPVEDQVLEPPVDDPILKPTKGDPVPAPPAPAPRVPIPVGGVVSHEPEPAAIALPATESALVVEGALAPAVAGTARRAIPPLTAALGDTVEPQR